jgi:hypothetical protein
MNDIGRFPFPGTSTGARRVPIGANGGTPSLVGKEYSLRSSNQTRREYAMLPGDSATLRLSRPACRR